MKKITIIAACMLLLCGAAFYFISMPRNVSDITAANGVLDLTDADFSKTLFNLNGEWEFYYEQLYTPEDFINGVQENGVYINVPMSWSKAGYPLKGFATYRLSVKTDEPELMMLVPEIQNSAVVFINGQKVFEAGKPGKSSADTVPGLRNAFLSVRPENGNIVVVVQAANYGWYTSGLQYSISIAHPSVLLNDALIRRILLGLIIGVMLALAFYHLILFVYSRKEWVYLVFTLLCMVVSARFFVEVNSFAELFLPDGRGVGLIKLYAALIALHASCLTVFTHLVFEKPFEKIHRAIYSVAFLIPAILYLILPYGTVNFQIWYLFVIPMVIALIGAARSKLLKDNPYNIMFLIAMGIFCIWYPFCKIVLNDILYMQAVVINLFLALCQCIMLSVGYAKTKQNEAELTAKTEFLNKLNRVKTEFLQDMNHELRTPLAVVGAGIDLIDEQINKENGSLETTNKSVDIIRNQTQRIGRMLDGMVEMAFMSETGENRQRVDFSALLKSGAEAFRIERQNVELRVEIEQDLPDVFIERDRFTQVIGNLFSNAARHTPNGLVTLSAVLEKQFITVRVADTGEGVSPEIMPRIFERGVSGSGRRSSAGGTGYGLYICKAVVEAHGGTIKIESNAGGGRLPGKGTVVTFTVPVYGGQEAGHK